MPQNEISILSRVTTNAAQLIFHFANFEKAKSLVEDFVCCSEDKRAHSKHEEEAQVFENKPGKPNRDVKEEKTVVSTMCQRVKKSGDD